MEKVRSLALIELTALFDSHSLPLHRRKPIKKKVKGQYKDSIIAAARGNLQIAFSSTP